MRVEVIDHGTYELHEREDVHIHNGKARVTPKEHKVPLEYYHYKMIISDDQFYAGNRLCNIFMMSNLNLYKTLQLQEVMGVNIDDGGASKYERKYRDAMSFLNYSYRPLIRNVCCFHDRTNHFAALREGLNDLKRFWDINGE